MAIPGNLVTGRLVFSFRLTRLPGSLYTPQMRQKPKGASIASEDSRAMLKRDVGFLSVLPSCPYCSALGFQAVLTVAQIPEP